MKTITLGAIDIIMKSFLLLIIILAFSFSALAQAKKPKAKPVAKPTPKTAAVNPPQKELITATYDPVKDQTILKHSYMPVASGPRQAFFMAAGFNDESSNQVFFTIYSVSKSYRYVDYRNITILVDGKKLGYKGERLAALFNPREASVDANGDAVEILTILLSVADLREIANAKRVDFTIWTDSFVLTPQNITSLREYVNKVDELRVKKSAKKSEQRANADIKPSEPPLPKCSLTMQQSPEIKGFRLGMSSRDIVPNFRNNLSLTGNRSNMDGVDVIVYAFWDFGGGGSLPRTKDWENVQYVRFRFLDDKLLVYEIHYDNKQLKLWKDTDTFVSVLSERMTLPSQLASNAPSKEFGFANSKWAYCDGWTLEMNANESAGKIMLTNTAATSAYLKDAEEKKKQEEERKRKSFKP